LSFQVSIQARCRRGADALTGVSGCTARRSSAAAGILSGDQPQRQAPAVRRHAAWAGRPSAYSKPNASSFACSATAIWASSRWRLSATPPPAAPPTASPTRVTLATTAAAEVAASPACTNPLIGPLSRSSTAIGPSSAIAASSCCHGGWSTTPSASASCSAGSPRSPTTRPAARSGTVSRSGGDNG
jgi:hypothetical protein